MVFIPGRMYTERLAKRLYETNTHTLNNKTSNASLIIYVSLKRDTMNRYQDTIDINTNIDFTENPLHTF